MSNPKFKKFSNRVVCPYDPDANLIEDYHAGDMICSMCGLVVGDRVIGNQIKNIIFPDQ